VNAQYHAGVVVVFFLQTLNLPVSLPSHDMKEAMHHDLSVLPQQLEEAMSKLEDMPQ
jgi:hypothetical protein